MAAEVTAWNGEAIPSNVKALEDCMVSYRLKTSPSLLRAATSFRQQPDSQIPIRVRALSNKIANKSRFSINLDSSG
jgi:hypothetical protein